MEIFKVVLTSVLSAVSLFIIAKFIGHKQMSQLDFFDYITGITIGSIAAELATELESPWKPLVAMVVYGMVSFLLTVMAYWQHRENIKRLIKGSERKTYLIKKNQL